MAFGRDMDAWQATGPRRIDFVEKENKSRFLTGPELKLLGVAGVGFFMDAYDLFIINMVVPILILVYFPKQAGLDGKHIPWGLQGGVLKAAANIGNVGGQVLFGFLGDSFGRQFVYGKELLIVIVSIIVMISVPDSLSSHNVITWITICRIIMGIGIGGDYPMSATIVADRANLKRRGALMSLLFSAQGWGGFVGAIVAVIVIACYKHKVHDLGDVHSLTGAWRILLGLGLVPAIAVLYFRLTMAESTKFVEARRLQDDPNLIHEMHVDNRIALPTPPGQQDAAKTAPTPNPAYVDGASPEKKVEGESGWTEPEDVTGVALGFKPVGKSAHNKEFFRYFSEWRHLKILIGTAMSWFLVDVAFYGINLNQSFILTAIKFTASEPYEKLMKTALGNLIIIAAGYLPGYYVSALLIEKMGRKSIQIMGFFFSALFLAIAGADFDSLKTKTAPFFVVFTLLQFFFNFGANTTTFIIPAEVFPSRVRATAHGVSAAVGKLGAILASLGFVEIANNIGTNKVLLIFMAFSLAGIPFTLLIPETTGYDADVVDRQELLEQAKARDEARDEEKASKFGAQA